MELDLSNDCIYLSLLVGLWCLNDLYHKPLWFFLSAYRTFWQPLDRLSFYCELWVVFIHYGRGSDLLIGADWRSVNPERQWTTVMWTTWLMLLIGTGCTQWFCPLLLTITLQLCSFYLYMGSRTRLKAGYEVMFLRSLICWNKLHIPISNQVLWQ